jgi:hypothetical protein
VKRCSKCGKEFPATIEYFKPRKGSRDGLRGTCRLCRRADDARRRNADRETYRKRRRQEMAAAYVANPEKQRAIARKSAAKRYAANPEIIRSKVRARHLKKRGYLIRSQLRILSGHCSTSTDVAPTVGEVAARCECNTGSILYRSAMYDVLELCQTILCRLARVATAANETMIQLCG